MIGISLLKKQFKNIVPKKVTRMLLVAFVFIIGISEIANATTRTSTATGGAWSSTATWVGGVVPATGDAVIIATTGAGNVSITAAVVQTSAGSVTINSGAILNMTTSGVNGTTFGSLTINGAGKFNCQRPLAILGATNISGTIAFASTSGTSRLIAFTGDVTLNAGAVWTEPATGFGANNTYTFAGNFTDNATTFSALGTGTHTFSGTAKTLSGATATIFKLMAVTGTITNNISTTLSVNTTLSGAGTLTQGTNAYLNIGGTITITTLTATANGNTVNYTAAATQTVKGTSYYNLTLSGTSAKTTTGVTVANVLSMEGTATASAAPTYGAAATLQYNTATARTAGPEWLATFAATGGGIHNKYRSYNNGWSVCVKC